MGFTSSEIEKFSIAPLINRCANDIQQVQMLTAMMLRMVTYAPILSIEWEGRGYHGAGNSCGLTD